MEASISFKFNSTLTTFDLKDNKIKFDEAQAILKGLEINSTLTTLDLSNNFIRTQEARDLSEAFNTISTLTIFTINDKSPIRTIHNGYG